MLKTFSKLKIPKIVFQKGKLSPRNASKEQNETETFDIDDLKSIQSLKITDSILIDAPFRGVKDWNKSESTTLPENVSLEISESSSIATPVSDSTQLSEINAFEGHEEAQLSVTECWKFSKSSGTTSPKEITTSPPTNVIQVQTHCRGCIQAFNSNCSIVSIFNPDATDPTLCLGCKRLLTFARASDIQLRFNHSANNIRNNSAFEACFMHEFCLHQHSSSLSDSADDPQLLYHLPLSTNYYSKEINKKGEAEFILCKTPTVRDKAQHLYSCSTCRKFVRIEREILKAATIKAGSRYVVASFQELFEFLAYNSTCMYSGLQGSWSNCGIRLFSLSLDYKVPLSEGGLSVINNLQVSLEGLHLFTEVFSHEEFHRWIEAFKESQGYYLN